MNIWPLAGWTFPPRPCRTCGQPVEQHDAVAVTNGPVYAGWRHTNCPEPGDTK